MTKREIGIVIISILSVASIEAMQRETTQKSDIEINYTNSILALEIGKQYPLQKAIHNSTEINTMKKLIIMYENTIDSLDNNGETPIHYASLLEFPHIIDLLFRSGSDLNVHNACSFTPLGYAVFGKRVKSAEKLLERGANANEVCIHPEKGSNLMKLFKRYGYTRDQEESLFITKGIVHKNCVQKLQNTHIEREKSS